MNNAFVRQKHLLLGTLFIAAFALITAFTFETILPRSLQQGEATDYVNFYHPVGERIAAGQGMTLPSGRIATTYPPGFPILIALTIGAANLFGLDYAVLIVIVMKICFSLSAVLIYRIARRYWSGPWALFPALVWAVYPFSLWLTQSPNVEMPFVVLLFTAVLFFCAALQSRRKRSLRLFLCGLSIGVAMLFRPIALGLGVLLAGVAALTLATHTPRQRFSLAALILVGNLLAVAGWEGWVYARSGKIIPLSSNGPASAVDGLTFGVNSKGYRNAVALPSGVVALMQDIRLAKTAGLPDGLAGTLVKLSAQHPVAAVQLLLIKLARSWYATDSGRGERMILLAQLPFIALLLGGLLLAWRKRQMPGPVLAVIVLIVAYFWAMTTAALSILRYMVPAFGIGFLAAPAAAQALLARYAQFRARNRVSPAQPAFRPEGNRVGGNSIPPAAPTWVPVTGPQSPASRETPAHSRVDEDASTDYSSEPENSETPKTALGE